MQNIEYMQPFFKFLLSVHTGAARESKKGPEGFLHVNVLRSFQIKALNVSCDLFHKWNIFFCCFELFSEDHKIFFQILCAF